MGKILGHHRIGYASIFGDPENLFFSGANIHYFDKKHIIQVSFVIHQMPDEIFVILDDNQDGGNFSFNNATPIEDRNYLFSTPLDSIKVSTYLRNDIVIDGPYSAEFSYSINAVHSWG